MMGSLATKGNQHQSLQTAHKTAWMAENRAVEADKATPEQFVSVKMLMKGKQR